MDERFARFAQPFIVLAHPATKDPGPITLLLIPFPRRPERTPEPPHHGVLAAEIVFVVRVLVLRLKPLKRELTGRERLLRCWAVDGQAPRGVIPVRLNDGTLLREGRNFVLLV